MQESFTQLRKKEYPAGEHPEEEYCMYCIVAEITK
jgi:hypothetical protein